MTDSFFLSTLSREQSLFLLLLLCFVEGSGGLKIEDYVLLYNFFFMNWASFTILPDYNDHIFFAQKVVS